MERSLMVGSWLILWYCPCSALWLLHARGSLRERATILHSTRTAVHVFCRVMWNSNYFPINDISWKVLLISRSVYFAVRTKSVDKGLKDI
jgi:hypothetical protein